MKKLPLSFYKGDNILEISRNLIGKIVVTNINGIKTSGRIAELEAYNGIIDKASHAAGGRRTKRNEIMYSAGGFAYVYLCYGLHNMLNVITANKEIPHAILIRSLEPLHGIAAMCLRTGKKQGDKTITKGPGNVGKALGIQLLHNGLQLNKNLIYIADDGFEYPKHLIKTSARIGIDYAGKDAKLPYRYYVKGNMYISGKPR